MTAKQPFPTRIETNHLSLERLDRHAIDLFEFYDFLTSDEWQGKTTEHMPWFRFEHLEEVIEFVERSERRWANCESARYLVRLAETDELIGTTAYRPEWETRRAGSDVVLSRDFWGNEYGLERAAAFIELTFELYDLDAYCSTCAAGNEPSRRMMEKYIETYGGRHEGLLRQHSPRPDGEVTDQHRFTILRSEYEASTAAIDTMQFDIDWTAHPSPRWSGHSGPATREP